MNGIDQMRWAKRLLEEKSGGAYELAADNVHGDLFLRCSDRANVGLYLSALPNRNTGRYDCIFQGYTRCSGNYYDASEMQRVAEKYQMVAALQKELETANISLSQDELSAFVDELLSAEEQKITTPQMRM